MEGNALYSEKAWLEAIRKNRIPVTVYMTNGFQMRGTVAEHDDTTILLTCDGQPQMLYKHAVSTVRPGRYANPGSGFLPHGN